MAGVLSSSSFTYCCMRVLAEGIRFAHAAVYVSSYCCIRVLAEGIRFAHTAVHVSSYCCIRALAEGIRNPLTLLYTCPHTAVYGCFAEGIRCLAVAYRGSTRLISRSHVLLYPGGCLLCLLLYLLLYCFTRCLADIAEARPPLSRRLDRERRTRQQKAPG